MRRRAPGRPVGRYTQAARARRDLAVRRVDFHREGGAVVLVFVPTEGAQ